MANGLKTKFLALVAVMVAGCATTPGSDQEDFGTRAARAMRAHAERDRALLSAVRDRVRADHAAMKAALQEAFGYRGTVVERSYSEQGPPTHRSERGPEPTPAAVAPYRDDRGRPLDVVEMKSIEMDVGLAEMLTPEGTLHPRAASALARMNAMAREHGGDFSVAVPRSQLHTVAAIQAVAPGATIVATDDHDYRLVVVAPER